MERNKINEIGITGNLFWRIAERFGAKSVELVVSIILARILLPEDYAIIALISAFISILQVFVDSGLGNALIQKKDADDIDFSTVFYFNIIFCLALYFLFFLVAPLIAAFYEDENLTPFIRVLGMTIVISGVKNVQQAYVSRHMLFRRFFFATSGGTIGAAVVGIALAYSGYGIWALVAQQVFNTAVDTIILWITVEWRPKHLFSFARLKELYSYGWKLLASHLLDTVYVNIRQLIIGIKYTKDDLAFYNRAEQFPLFIISIINTSISSVLFPVVSSVQDDKGRVKALIKRAIKISTYIIAPMMLGLAACSDSVVKLVLTEKWLGCVPYLRIFCITYIFYPLHLLNLDAMKALGRSDLFLRLEIIKKIMGLIVLFSTMWFGVMAMAYSALFTSLMSQIINSWPNKKLLNYPYLEQLKDILPAILLALGMGAVVYCVQFLHLNNWLTLLIQVPLGVSLYVAGSKLFRLESYEYVLHIGKNVLSNHLKKV